MNQGGVPKGKRAATLHKEQVQRELADPSLRDARVAEDKAKRRAFIGLIGQQPAKRSCNEQNLCEAGSLNPDHENRPCRKSFTVVPSALYVVWMIRRMTFREVENG